MDEVFIHVRGEVHYLWRAVDQDGVVLDILVQERRNATAAKRFFKRLLAGLGYRSERIVTERLRSYGVAHREVLPETRHHTSRYLNNRTENSHQPTRRREQQVQAVQVTRAGPALPRGARHDLRPLPTDAAPDELHPVPARTR
jgi:putative transposase